MYREYLHIYNYCRIRLVSYFWFSSLFCYTVECLESKWRLCQNIQFDVGVKFPMYNTYPHTPIAPMWMWGAWVSGCWGAEVLRCSESSRHFQIPVRFGSAGHPWNDESLDPCQEHEGPACPLKKKNWNATGNQQLFLLIFYLILLSYRLGWQHNFMQFNPVIRRQLVSIVSKQYPWSTT